MNNTPTLRGFCTLCYYVTDHAAAVEWYTTLFGMEPYFNRPGYSEFRIGDYQHEFGLIDASYAPAGWTPGPAGPTVYWFVEDIQAMQDRLVSMGARIHEPIMERGKGFVTASVIDPFGNILGIMYNEHYLEVLNNQQSEQ